MYESGPRHAGIIVEAMGMKVGEKGNVTTPGAFFGYARGHTLGA